MARSARNELAYEQADGRRWLNSGAESGDGAKAVNAANNAVTYSTTALGRSFSTATMTTEAGQWYAATIKVLSTTGDMNVNGITIDNEDESDALGGNINNPAVGVNCLRFRTLTAKVINFDYGMGTGSNETGSKSIVMTQPCIEKIDSVTDVPSRLSLPQMKSVFDDDKSGTTVSPLGLVTFGAGVPVGDPIDVVLVHSDSFNNEPTKYAGDGEWGWRLNAEANIAAYIDALGGRTLEDAAPTVGDSLQLTDHLEASYYSSAGTLIYPSLDTNVNKPNLLVVDLGLNDVSQNKSLSEMQAAFELEVTNSRAVDANLTIIVNNVSPWKNGVGWNSTKQAVQDTYNAWLPSRVATDSNMYLNDIYSPLGESGDPEALAGVYSLDGTHPNSAGSQVITDLIVDLIASISSESPTLTRNGILQAIVTKLGG